jgi:4-amino-4-deoxy-L-arabinose transferase-like glycosyltransferase
MLSGTTELTQGRPNAASNGLRVPTRWWFILLLALYFAGHVVLRLYTRSIPELDEGWQVALAQYWSPGYHAQAPLYTWLQIVVFKVFGESIFSLALLKNGLLFALYLFIYGSAKAVTRRHDWSVFTTLCLLLIPQISWECHRDLTHSVVLAATIAATLFTFLRLVEKPTWERYAALGFCVALVLLSKYNGAVFLAGGIIGAFLVPRYRAVLLDRRILLAFVISVGVAGPHFTWALLHPDQAFATTRKLGRIESFGTAAARLPGNLAAACLPNLTSMLVIYILGRGKRLLGFKSEAARLLFWGSIAAIGLAVIGMLAAHATSLRGRWFLPIYVVAPVLVIAQLEVVPRWLFRLVTSAAAFAVIAVFTLLPINAARGGKKGNDLTPYTMNDLVNKAGDAVRSADLIVSDDLWVAGALRLEFKKPVVTPTAVHESAAGKRVAVVYTCRWSTEPPKVLRDFLEKFASGRSLRTIHITPADDPMKSGMPLAVALLE